MDRLTALRTFILVAEQKSFAKAARRLRVSATAVSRAVGQLEDELGVTLLRRTTRSVSVSPEGATYIERCKRILEDLDEADRSLRGEGSEPRGTLTVTAPAMFGRLHILPVINGLMRAYSGLNVQLSLTDRVMRVVEEVMDVAVRIADLPDSALHAIRIAETRRVLVASPDYLAERGEPSDPLQLHDHDLIVIDTQSPNNEWRFTAEGRPAIRCEPRLFTNSVEAAVESAVQGLGVARTLSYQVRDHVRAGRLIYILKDMEPPPAPVSLVFQANRQRTANASAFMAACQHYCARQSFD